MEKTGNEGDTLAGESSTSTPTSAESSTSTITSALSSTSSTSTITSALSSTSSTSTITSAESSTSSTSTITSALSPTSSTSTITSALSSTSSTSTNNDPLYRGCQQALENICQKIKTDEVKAQELLDRYFSLPEMGRLLRNKKKNNGDLLAAACVFLSLERGRTLSKKIFLRHIDLRHRQHLSGLVKLLAVVRRGEQTVEELVHITTTEGSVDAAVGERALSLLHNLRYIDARSVLDTHCRINVARNLLFLSYLSYHPATELTPFISHLNTLCSTKIDVASARYTYDRITPLLSDFYLIVSSKLGLSDHINTPELVELVAEAEVTPPAGYNRPIDVSRLREKVEAKAREEKMKIKEEEIKIKEEKMKMKKEPMKTREEKMKINEEKNKTNKDKIKMKEEPIKTSDDIIIIKEEHE